MELIEKIIAAFSPERAAKRAFWRLQADRLYDAAKSHPQHRRPGQQGSGDRSMDHARENIRDWARWLDENHDLAIGILDDLVNKTIGAEIKLMPLAANGSGELAREFNRQVSTWWREWSKRPEVTQELSNGMMQRLAMRTLLRDGEILGQHVVGTGGRIVHGSAIPYSLELIEADYLPFAKNEDRPHIVHGVEKTAWGRPRAYHVYRKPPDTRRSIHHVPRQEETKRVPVERMLHAKFIRRIGQTRGVSIFHGVAHRLDDIKDYEESERIAARILASVGLFITKGADFSAANAFDEHGKAYPERTMEMQPGMIMDNLRPGEDIRSPDMSRPNTGLNEFRDGQLRAVAAGTGSSYSSISRNYNGTYSAQRQELVEAQAPYAALREMFISSFLQPVYEQFLRTLILVDAVTVPVGVDPIQLFAAGWIAPPMPWVDPKKEIEADQAAVDSHFVPWGQVVLQRTGRDPVQVLEQMRREQEMLDEVFGVQEPVDNDAGDIDNDDDDAGDIDNDDENDENAGNSDDDEAAA